MARVIGYAGSSARQEAYFRFFSAPVFAFIVFGLLSPLVAWSLIGVRGAFGWSVVLLAVAAVFVLTRRDIKDAVAEMRSGMNFAKGAAGESLTARELDRLGDEYIVVHDFHPLIDGKPADWNVDHIVIGPNGVFVLDTKNYSSKRVPPADKSGVSKKNVSQAQRNAAELKSKLRTWSGGSLSDVFVMPVVVYVQDGAYVERLREGFVDVLPLKMLLRHISTRSPRRPVTRDETLRVATVLLNQMAPHLQADFREGISQYRAQGAPRL